MCPGTALTLALLTGCGSLGLDLTWSDTGGPAGPGPGVDSGDGHEDDTDPPDDTREEPNENAPELTSFDLTEREPSDTVQVAFESFDLDGDLVGGSAHLTLGGANHVLDIPDDLDSWSATGTSRFQVDASSLPHGTTVNGSLYLVDAAGNSSSTMSGSVALTDDGGGDTAITVTETGDTIDTAYDLGVISLPVTVHGELDSVSHDAQGNYTGDYDWLQLRVGSTTSATITLSWEAPNGDYDLFLVDSAGNVLAAAQSETTSPPENISRSLTAGTTYYIVVIGWSGAAAGWTVLIH
ncbi:MAG: hypothetical protein ABIO70_19060 [Pseudomonadota bacterium]